MLGLEPASPLHLICAAIDAREDDPWREPYEKLAAVVSDFAASHPEWLPAEIETPPVITGL